jgi:hypothetical protein
MKVFNTLCLFTADTQSTATDVLISAFVAACYYYPRGCGSLLGDYCADTSVSCE